MSEVRPNRASSSAEPDAEGKLTSVVRQTDTEQRRPGSTTTSSSVRGRRAALQLQKLEEERAIKLEKIKLEEEFIREKFRIMETQCGEEDESVSQKGIAAERVASWLTQSNASITPDEGDVTCEIRRMRAELGNQKPVNEERARTVETSWTLTKEQKAARQALPKDLPEFNGDPAEWPTFISNFNFSTKACGYQHGENMIRLQRCLKGAAKDAVRGRLLLPESVPSVINALKRRFGRPELLLEVMIEQVRKIPSPRADDLEGLIEFGKVTQSLCEHVRSAGMVEHITNPMLISELIEKLPTEYRMRWARWSRGKSCGSLQTLAEFMEQITEDAISITRLPGKRSYRAKEDGGRQPPRTNTKATFTSSKASVREQCAICSETHRTFRCEKLISMAVQQRREVATQKKLCWNCLGAGHQVLSCTSKHVCRVCSQKHHTLLHETTQEGASASLSARVCANTVVLETATFWVIDRYGNRHHARALLDSASMCNFISRKLAEKLQLRWTKTNTNIVGIAESCHQVKFEIRATIQSKLNSFNSSQNFMIMTKPTGHLPTSMVNINDIRLPDVQLADAKFNIPAPIDIILGAEIYQSLFTGKRIELDAGNPTLVETVFGWIIGGPIREEMPTKSLACHLTLVGLENVLQRFWQLDAVPERSQQPDNHCEEFYVSTTIRDKTGRYAVRLPQTNDTTRELGESRSIALRRFQTLEKRLNSDDDLKRAYHEFMNEYERLGHMKKVDNPDNNMAHCFLPHHAVFKASSTTTKTRVVFDASCKTASGYSLNDILLVGPVVQRDLLVLLMQFRFHAIALVGDIEKMYRQIGVQAVDQPLQRILWRKNPEEAISTYQLQTVTYGTSSAPYLATRTLQRIAQDMSHMSPKAANVISKDFYVDDLLSGATEESAAIQLRKEISEMLASAGMSMKKWASNSIEVLNSIPLEDRAIDPWHNFQDKQTVSTLGLIWEPQSDVLSFKVQPPDKVENYTKRIVLSQIAKIFDPLGLAGPVITRAKIFMQSLWTAKSSQGRNVNWDEPLDTQIQIQWREFYETIGLLNQLRIPRFVTLHTPRQCELHLFADASEKAYGACCYVRTEAQHQIAVRLLTAKSKVAPIATRHTIARLELCAALLATTLYQQIDASLEIPHKVYFWSDSTTTLHWIQSSPARWNIFVANRVSRIQEIHSAEAWNYVPGKDNPADDISRGLSATEFLNNERWWLGPTWLRSTKEFWPDQPINETHTPEALQESKRTNLRCMKVVRSEFATDLFMRHSSYYKLRRLMAYWARYMKRLRYRLRHHNSAIAKGTIDPITTEELHASEHSLCRMAQGESFYEEHTELLRAKHVSRSSRLKWLNPQLDEKGLIRVGGRLSHAKISEDARHPIVLCSKHPLTRMIAEYYHRKLLHAGPQLMLSTIHLKFWILSGRNLVRTVYHQCHTCFHHRPLLIQQSMADLPSSRVIPSRPFLTCGVDYFGPVFIKSEIRNRTASKAYVAIFICFVTRAVHIELVSDLSTNAFLATLCRFVARRGKPSDIYSDNATCFKGAANQLHKVYRMLQKESNERDKIINWCTDNEIQWHFIPPRAPQFGGLWEAAVKSAKHHFLREIGTSNISREDMTTLLAQVEMCLNSRPLVHMPTETADLEVLTPGHFLIGGNLQAISEVPLQEIPENRLSHWERTQQRTQRFWTRWRREYLQQLQTRATKGCNPPVSIDVGRVVLLKEDNAPPATWPLGRIIATHPGKDGVVRVVTLKTANADNVVRPVTKIAPLPCSMQIKDVFN